MKKNCVICGKLFNGKGYCCSEECSTQYKREYSMKYREEHKEERKEYFKQKSQERCGTAKVIPAPKVSNRDPEWIKEYNKGDRLTKISMLAIALTDYQIKLMTYGRLSPLWGTEKYASYERQVFKRKRSENEKKRTPKKNRAKGKNRSEEL